MVSENSGWSLSGAATATRVVGDGVFAEVGEPTTLAVSDTVVVIGGSLGWAQSNVRTAVNRSDRHIGWYPIGVYDTATLACRCLITSRWAANCVAIHPSGDLVAIGTGAYDGGYFFEGELLIHNVNRGTTVSVLTERRCVEEVRWVDAETLELVLAPPTDEDAGSFADLRYHRVSVEAHWAAVGPRSIQLPSHTTTDRPIRDQGAAHQATADLATAHGLEWRDRRQAWAVLPCDDGGLIVGVSAAVERWGARGSAPQWRTELDGTCTQLTAGSDNIGVAVWADGQSYDDRVTTLKTLNAVTGSSSADPFDPGHPSCVIARADGHLLVRDTRHAQRRGSAPATILDPTGSEVGRVELSTYDLFNHYLDVRRAKDFLVLVGEAPRPWEDKWVAAVRGSSGGTWEVERLFPLAWTPGAHLFGGPGAYVDDDRGDGVVHAGTVHDGRGLLPGNGFIVRRSYPDGGLVWHHALDNQVTGLDECDGAIIAVTNTGEMVVLDALNGKLLARRDALLAPGGHRIVPLTLAVTSPRTVVVGAFDGRALEFAVPGDAEPA